ncbi:hypothetical protein BDZ45DRAFT_697353 [Acephala macrosclerotiorum]|nr:hypothetical protein BDZ45DRAFT_697353 [Acephala macrosclerotiorum]
MTGGGIYAVNKLVKTAERRDRRSETRSLPSTRGYREDNGQPQGYWGPPPPPPPPPPRPPFDPNSYTTYQDQPKWYPANDNARGYPPPPGYSPQDYTEDRHRYRADDHQPQQASGDASCYQPQQRYAAPSQDQGFDDGAEQRHSTGLAGMAIDFVGKRGGDSGSRSTLDQGMQLASGFLRK